MVKKETLQIFFFCLLSSKTPNKIKCSETQRIICSGDVSLNETLYLRKINIINEIISFVRVNRLEKKFYIKKHHP